MDKSKRSNNSWSARQLKKMWENGTINFDHPIQRKGIQWESFRQSEFIHSLAEGYPVYPCVALKEDGVYYILDGKQRLTTVFRFINNKFALHDLTPDCDGHPMAELIFDELHEDLQDEIINFMFNIKSYEGLTDEEIEIMFERLNLGKPLSNIQRAKAKLGVRLSEKVSVLTDHEIFNEKIPFSESNIKGEANLKVISEYFMLKDIENNKFEMKKTGFTPTVISDYLSGLRNRPQETEELIELGKKVLDYLFEVIEKPNKQFLKPTNLPMLFNVASYAVENGIPSNEFKAWYDSFVEGFKAKDEDEQSEWIQKYKQFGGDGSKKPEKYFGRVNTLLDSLKDSVKEDVSPTLSEQAD
ncbi:DUF262 domain-containing protein [Bacillus sonorensis]|uniref:DUF262 domain-containing protein n=1 Tax=Bacillus subtilis group TaxID=653685 RepID=UPI001FD6B15D|nr:MULTISPECIES: DUF262 domain-containing protein [Bacillus subtilis group]MCJ8223725.1 DUF262 domain-containing protein [Bacillus paralicheniformis]MEC0526211.1 DUF262 domain-containing protein [Bacillus sonorensis]